MTQPIHTPGPVMPTRDDAIVAIGSDFYVAQIMAISPKISAETRERETANARLLAAAYNAFDSAAKLNINAVECAERMADGGISELVEALDYLLAQTVHMDLKHGITLSEGEEEARARGIAIISKVRGAS